MDARLEALVDEGGRAFAFLVGERGFSLPSDLEDGVRYERDDLAVEVRVWTWNRETGFSTTLSWPAAGGGTASVQLDDASAAFEGTRLGTTAATGHTVRKRVQEHAAALRVLLDDERFREAVASGRRSIPTG